MSFYKNFLLGALTLYASSSYATTYTWNLNGSGDWNNALFWVPSGFPNNQASDEAILGGAISAPSTLTLGTPIGVNFISFNNANSYTIASFPSFENLTFGGTAPAIVIFSGAHSITSPVVLNGPLFISNMSTSPFMMSGGTSGTGSLEVSGGTLVFTTTANTYSGGTTIDGPAGVISISQDSFLGLNTAALNFDNNGGRLLATGSFSMSRPINLNGTGVIDTSPMGFSVTLSGIVAGPGDLIKENGILILQNTGNTYSGETFCNGGVIQVSADGCLGSGGGALNLNIGTLQITTGFSTSRSLILGTGDGTIDTMGNNLGLTGLISGPGALTKIGAGTLLLENGSNSYAGGTYFDGGIVNAAGDGVFGTGALTFNGGTLQLGNSFTSNRTVTFTGAGTIDTNFNDLTLTGNMTGAGGLTKSGGGILTLTGNNNYTGGTTVSFGTLEGTTSGLQGHITNNAAVVFNQSNTGTYAGSMMGSGTVTIAGSGKVIFSGTNTYTGTTTISGGTFCVNGSITSNTTVDAGTTLCGTGTISGSANVFGTISPGNSIGTLTITGPVTFETGSTYQVEVSPTQADLLNVTAGTVTIDPGVTFALMPDIGDYADRMTYLVIQTTGGVSGTFSAITNSFPMLFPTLTYTGTDVFLTIAKLPFGPIIPSGNAKNIAKCLDAATPIPGSDLDLIIGELLMVTDIASLEHDLNQMQPSQLKGLALSQENNSISVREALSSRIEDLYEPTCKSDRDRKQEWDIWTDLFGDISQQKSLHHEPGYRATTGGALLGADYFVLKNLHLGAAAAYTNTNLHWQHSRGRGDIQSYYGLVYAGFFNSHFFANASVRGAYNQYEAKRHIRFLTIDRHAKSVFGGGEVGTHLTVGGLFAVYKVELNPFLTFDYVHLHQDGFKERGAKSLDLKLKDSNYNFFRGELGLSFSRCFITNSGKWIPMAKFSVIRELRYQGAHYDVQLVDTGCTFSVTGLNPDRTLYAPAAGLIALLCDEKLSVSLKYEGEFGKRFWDQKLNNTVVANISFILASKKKPLKLQKRRGESSYSPFQGE